MDHRYAALARKLRELGLWQHLPARDADAGERAVAGGSHPLGGLATLDEEPGVRYLDVDGETMAEGGVDRTLREFAPVLREHGVDLRVTLVSHPALVDGSDYVVAINDRRCLVWTADDWTSDNPWWVSTVRPLAVVNDLLAEAGAIPRLYTLTAGGNQGEAWLLDPRIVTAMADSGLFDGDSLPALPTHV